jgi:hypothetical protein
MADINAEVCVLDDIKELANSHFVVSLLYHTDLFDRHWKHGWIKSLFAARSIIICTYIAEALFEAGT